MKGGKTHYDFFEEIISPSGRKPDSSVSKAVSFLDRPCSNPWLSSPKRHLCLPRTEAPSLQTAAVLASLALSSHLVVELPPAPETQLQELACVALDDFQANSAEENSGLHGLTCRCQGGSSQTAGG